MPFFYCQASGKALSGAQAGVESGLIQKEGTLIIDSGTIGMQSSRTSRTVTKMSARYIGGRERRVGFSF